MSIDLPYSPASERAKKIVKDVVVIDSLNCIALFRGPGWADRETDAELVYGYLERAREAGVTAMAATVGVDPERSGQTLTRITSWLDAIARYPERYILVRNTEDIREAQASGRLGIFFTNQGACCFDEEPNLVGLFRQLGVGYCLLAYNNRYRTGDGAYEPDDAGLTAWGRDLVKAMSRYGMPVDISHTGIRASREALELLREIAPGKPPIYSHTGLKRHVDHTRAATDENARALVAAGGVMNINLCNPVITDNPTTEMKPDDCAAAIDTAVQFAGIDHVGIATDDFEDMGPFIAFVRDKHDKYPDGGRSIQTVLDGKNRFAELAKTLPAIVDCLLEKDYSENDVQKVIGGNMMRVLEATWDKGICSA